MSELFAVTEYCTVHQIDPSFVYTLQDEGLITIVVQHDRKFVEEEELHKLEIFTRLYAQLGLHPESMEIVSNLLEKVKRMQDEMNDLRMRLRIQGDGTNF